MLLLKLYFKNKFAQKKFIGHILHIVVFLSVIGFSDNGKSPVKISIRCIDLSWRNQGFTGKLILIWFYFRDLNFIFNSCCNNLSNFFQ